MVTYYKSYSLPFICCSLYNVLLFQAPKIILNVEVIEAMILKPADANGMCYSSL
jgi:hypothetical protein